MGKVKQVFVDLELDDPDQEYTDTEIRAVAAPLLTNIVAFCLFIACSIVLCSLGAGRI